MTAPVSLDAALEARARQILYALAPRFYSTLSDRGDGSMVEITAGHWVGWMPNDPLERALETADVARYTRPGGRSDGPALRLGRIEMIDVVEESRSPIVTVESNVVERQRQRLTIPAGVKFSETLSHTFSRTRSEAEATKEAWGEAAKEAWGVGAKASVGFGAGPVKGAVEATAKYERELTARHDAERSSSSSGSETSSDTVSRHVEVEGPADLVWEAYRSLDREKRTVVARGDFDHSVWLDPGPDRPGLFVFDSFVHDFLPVAAQLAPETATLARSFREWPVSPTLLEKLRRPADAVVEFVVPFDAVQTRHLTIVPKDEREARNG